MAAYVGRARLARLSSPALLRYLLRLLERPGVDESARVLAVAELTRRGELRDMVRAYLGREPAEWDFDAAEPAGPAEPSDLPGWVGAEGSAGRASHPPHRPYIVPFLDRIRSPFNVGAIMRTSAAFGIGTVILDQRCPRLDHPRLVRSAMGTLQHVRARTGTVEDARALVVSARDAASGGELVTEGDAVTVGVAPVPIIVADTGGLPIEHFVFPEAGVLVVGHEEEGVAAPLLDRARAEGRLVSIVLDGPKRSLNVGAAYAIVLHRWVEQLRSAARARAAT